MKIGKKIREARINANLRQADLAKLVYTTTRTIQNYEADKQIPNIKMMTQIANSLKIPIDFFINEDNAVSCRKYVVSQDKKVVVSCRKSPNLSPSDPLNSPKLKKSQNEIHINIKDDTIYVPFFKDGAVSAGFGTEDFGNDCDFLPFKKQDLRLMFNAHSTANLAVIPCVGNSMQPTIEEGELVVFQQDGTQSEGAIYVVRFENELFVKRLKKRPLQLISDNVNYEPISLNESQSFEILGRVIGSYSIHSKRF